MGEKDKLVLIGSPLLWERSQPIRDPRAQEVHRLAERLAVRLRTLREQQPDLRSLSAPQIGVQLRLAAVLLNGSSEPLILANPWVVEASLENLATWEECGSIPDLRFKIERFSKVTVEYVDLHGSGQTLQAMHRDASTLQHTIDHFNGFLLTDRLSDPRRIVHRHAESAVAVDATPGRP